MDTTDPDRLNSSSTLKASKIVLLTGNDVAYLGSWEMNKEMDVQYKCDLR